MLSLTSQLLAFVVMVAAGFLVGLMFDMYRVTRALIRPHARGSIIMDLVFWMVVTPAFFLMLLAGNWGELRFYVFLGTALGLFVYFQLASAFVLWGLITFARWLGRVLALTAHTVVRVVTAPLAFYRQLQLISWRWRSRKQPAQHKVRRPFRPILLIRTAFPWGKAWPFGRR